MLTPSYGVSANTYALPSVSIDFTKASLDARITLTRALNTATCFNSSGYIATVNANLPRFDYNPITLACNGLLIEETRINYILQSNVFNVTWTNLNTVLTSAAAVSPDGTTNAFKSAANTTAGVEHYLEQTVSINTNQEYKASIYVKQAGYTGNFDFNIVAVGSSTAVSTARFNVNASGVVTFTGTRSGIISATGTSSTSIGNGWYRLVVNYTLNGTVTSHRMRFYPSGVNGVMTGDGTSGLYLYGAQIEVGAFPTSLIPTTTTTLTRNADVAVMTSTNFSSWWVATTGGIVTRATPSTISGTRPVIQFDDTTANNLIALRGNIADPELYIKATTDQVQIDAGTLTAGTAYNLGASWNTNNCAASLNGGAVGTDLSATIPTVTQARIGCDGTNYLNGTIQNFRYWPQAITNNEVQAFSK